MLNKLPAIGQLVEALENGAWDDTKIKYQTEGDVYEIVGISDKSGAAYFIGDQDEPIYIDEEAFDLYELYEESKGEITFNKTEVSIYSDESLRFEIKFSSYGEFAHENMMYLREDIKRLIKDKYS